MDVQIRSQQNHHRAAHQVFRADPHFDEAVRQNDNRRGCQACQKKPHESIAVKYGALGLRLLRVGKEIADDGSNGTGDAVGDGFDTARDHHIVVQKTHLDGAHKSGDDQTVGGRVDISCQLSEKNVLYLMDNALQNLTVHRHPAQVGVFFIAKAMNNQIARNGLCQPHQQINHIAAQPDGENDLDHIGGDIDRGVRQIGQILLLISIEHAALVGKKIGGCGVGGLNQENAPNKIGNRNPFDDIFQQRQAAHGSDDEKNADELIDYPVDADDFADCILIVGRQRGVEIENDGGLKAQFRQRQGAEQRGKGTAQSQQLHTQIADKNTAGGKLQHDGQNLGEQTDGAVSYGDGSSVHGVISVCSAKTAFAVFCLCCFFLFL